MSPVYHSWAIKALRILIMTVRFTAYIHNWLQSIERLTCQLFTVKLGIVIGSWSVVRRPKNSSFSFNRSLCFTVFLLFTFYLLNVNDSIVLIKETLFLRDATSTVVRPLFRLSTIICTKKQQSCSKVACSCLLQACSVFQTWFITFFFNEIVFSCSFCLRKFRFIQLTLEIIVCLCGFPQYCSKREVELSAPTRTNRILSFSSHWAAGVRHHHTVLSYFLISRIFIRTVKKSYSLEVFVS